MDGHYPYIDDLVAKDTGQTAREIRVRGRVQGVGFRPHVYALAEKNQLTGWVKNDTKGVLIHVEGKGADAFCSLLSQHLPPLAVIDSITVESVPILGFSAFEIVSSDGGGTVATMIPADAAICGDCLDDIFTPTNRRYGYPFTNCTNCGPRYTITNKLPYDRANSSMASFTQCPACQREYDDPSDRRFHAQPNACADCGPRLTHSVAEIAETIQAGGLVALKGLGGFHLVCDASNEGAVARLRSLKSRKGKPLAIMVPNAESAAKHAIVSPQERASLTDKARPIVILEALPEKSANKAGLASGVQAGLNSLGVMLPYLPLHYLLFQQLINARHGTDWLNEAHQVALVMTSCNLRGEPLLIRDEDVAAKIGDKVDLIVGHDRAIISRVDDSIVRVRDKGMFTLRRARSFAPEPVDLACDGPTVLGLGSNLKSTITVARGDQAFVSQYIGDLDHGANRAYYRETIQHYLSILDAKPDVIAVDAHPDFCRFVLDDFPGVPVMSVQHHHAHLAAVAAEYGETALFDGGSTGGETTGGAIGGLALDGFGLGDNGKDHWGGECLLLTSDGDFKRFAGLSPLAQPGGDKAARDPWRMAVSQLYKLGLHQIIQAKYGDREGLDLLLAMLAGGVNSPQTSSAGRLFDAISSLLGICHHNEFEGEAAMLLEGMVDRPTVAADGWTIASDGSLDMSPLVQQLTKLDTVSGACLFHGSFAAALVAWVEFFFSPVTDQNAASHQQSCAGDHAPISQTGLPIALGGGCFQNRILTDLVQEGLEQKGYRVLVPQKFPANDGGLSLGQVFVARQRLATGQILYERRR